MKVRFLLDENLSPRLKLALLRREASIVALRVGDAGAPALGTLDPDILRYLETAGMLLVTDNRVSMPRHVAEHLAAGGHHWGIFHLRPGATMAQITDSMCLLWEASDAAEWVDRLEWLPF
jgi:hypothetical protein